MDRKGNREDLANWLVEKRLGQIKSGTQYKSSPK